MSLWSWLTTDNRSSPGVIPAVPRRRLRMGRLEDRVLMNATAMPEGGSTVELTNGDDPNQQAVFTDDLLLPPPDIILCDCLPPEEATITLSEFSEEQPTELIVIDSQVTDVSTLLAQLAEQAQQRQFDILKIEANEDGVQAIANAVAGHQYAAIHILTHATDGSVQLGDQWLRTDQLDGVATDLARWGDGLTTDGDILFYGCNLAAGTGGQELLHTIAELTHADVAASTDLTGQRSWGGDWELEFTVGLVTTGVALDPAGQQAWQGLLAPPVITTTSFQTGVGGYTGTIDTFIESDKPTSDNSTATKLVADISPVNQILIRFDNIFGSAAGQIPWGSTITSASLAVDVENTGANGALIELHRVLVPWTDTSNWNSLVAGISINDIEAFTAAESTLSDPSTNGSQTFSGLAASLQAWSNGDANYGWVVTNNNANDWKLRSAEEGTVADRPMLSVNYTPPTLDPTSQRLVNTTTGNTQETALNNRGASQAVAMANNGDYVVVWSSESQDSSGWGVFGRRYDNNGVAQGGGISGQCDDCR